MIGGEVYEVLETICQPQNAFFDVIGCDMLKSLQPTRWPIALIVNTKPAPQPGHWCAFFMKSEQSPIEFFDAFCIPSVLYNDEFIMFMRRMSGKQVMMPRAIQCFDSSFCGHHCLRYLSSRLTNLSIQHIYTHIFKPGCRSNDSDSKFFVENVKNWIKFREWFVQGAP